MNFLYSVCAFSSLLYLKVVLAVVDSECTFWNQLANNLSHAYEQNSGAVRLACKSSCTNITCSGHFKAPAMVVERFEFDFCFGLRLNHCDNPISMDFYLNAPSLSLNKSGTFSHNDSLDIPGPKIMGTDSTIVILVEMVPINRSFIVFGVNGNLRLTLGSITTFPIKERVFPPTYIDIPPCLEKPKTRPPFTSPAVCEAPPSTEKPPLTTTASKTAGPTKNPVIHSKTYNQSCELGLLKCGNLEMCRVRNENDKVRSGICVCNPESVFDPKSGLCVLQSTSKPATTKPTGVPSVTMANKQKSEHTGVNMTAVIIGAVFGGLLLIVVLVSIIIFLGRRRRQADYRGRHQLLSDQNDDDDDTNVVI